MKRIYLVALFSVFVFGISAPSLAELFSYTGKYKVHEDKCYEQIDASGKGLQWREFNCIKYLEDSFLDLQILNELYNYSRLVQEGRITKGELGEITQKAVLAGTMRLYLTNEQILKRFREDANQILRESKTKK